MVTFSGQCAPGPGFLLESEKGRACADSTAMQTHSQSVPKLGIAGMIWLAPCRQHQILHNQLLHHVGGKITHRLIDSLMQAHKEYHESTYLLSALAPTSRHVHSAPHCVGWLLFLGDIRVSDFVHIRGRSVFVVI